MNKYIVTAIFAIAWNIVHSQVTGVVKDQNKLPLVGATVYWEGTSQGCVTDSKGEFSIESTGSGNVLIISFIGFETQKVSPPKNHKVQVILQPDSEVLADINVVSRDKGAHESRISIIQTTKLTGAELCKAACCNLAESFTTNASVDMSYSDAATGAKQIRLLGLSGTYVQMMAENMPAFRGLASVYGLEYIPGAWMESIQVSKGSSSVINGYEAIAGQINVEYKKPENSEKFFVNGFYNSELRHELNINSSLRLNEKLSTMILAHFKDGDKAVDNNDDGFLDMPMIKQYNFINRWNYANGKYQSKYGVKVIDESRRSGQIAFYNDDASAYGINVETRRYEIFSKQALVFNNHTGHSIALQASGSNHEQNSFYGNRIYEATQKNAYLNLIYQNIINDNPSHEYSIGTSFMFDEYDERLNSENFIRTEKVPGIFGQYTYNGNDRFTFLVGLRGDFHNEYGFFLTPRLHSKYNVNDHIHLRASVGMGYRSANVLAENSYLFASSRQVEITEKPEQEKALNSGLNATFFLPVFDKDLTISTDYYYTKFYQQVMADVDSDPRKVSFYNLDGISYSHSFQAQANYEIVRGLSLTAAYRITDVKMTIGDELREKPLTNRFKGLITASYQTPLKKWQIDFTSQFNGGGRMPTPKRDLWEEEYSSYTIFNAQITKYFRKWNVYIGSENLGNFKMDTPIIDAVNPGGDNFDASMTWGPVHGRMIYGGFRFAIDRE